MSHKEYLGDAVYCELNDFGEIVLTTENGREASNIIVIEPAVWRALCDYVRRCREEMESRET